MPWAPHRARWSHCCDPRDKATTKHTAGDTDGMLSIIATGGKRGQGTFRRRRLPSTINSPRDTKPRPCIAIALCTKVSPSIRIFWKSVAYMFGLFGVSSEELQSLGKTCKLSLAAYQACLRANDPDKKPCKNLEAATIACAAAKKCPDQYSKYVKCVHLSHSQSTQEGRLRTYKSDSTCVKELNAMTTCLKRKGVWPKLLNVPMSSVKRA